jgi:hypothetical protein
LTKGKIRYFFSWGGTMASSWDWMTCCILALARWKSSLAALAAASFPAVRSTFSITW